jgi:hypothetical protein
MTRYRMRRLRRAATGAVGMLAMLSFAVALGTPRTLLAGDDPCADACYDANPCTYDNGDSINQYCYSCSNDDVPDGTPCATPPGTCAASGSASRCVSGRCTPYQGSPPCMDDENPCTYNRCEVKGCKGPNSYPKKPAGTPCKDFVKVGGVIVHRNDCTTSGHSGHASTCNANGICGSCRTSAGCARVAGPWGGALKYCLPVSSPNVIFNTAGFLDDGDAGGCQ